MAQGDFTALALDLGKTFGWAFSQNGIITASGEISLTDDTHPGLQYKRFNDFLYDFRCVNEIYYERVSGFKGADAAMNYGAFKAAVQLFSLIHGVDLRSMPVKDIKKKFTGNGNAPKEKMCEVAMRLGWKNGVPDTRINNNECDAIALMWCVLKEIGMEPKFGILEPAEPASGNQPQQDENVTVDEQKDLSL